MQRTLSCKYLAFLVVGLFAASLPGCGSKNAPKPVETHKSGDLNITLLSESGNLTQGQNDFIVEFKSAANDKPVDVGRVVISSTMAMPGMAPMSAGLELTPAGETGRYRAKGAFGMSGAWRFAVQWDGPAGQGSTTFNQSVR